MANPETVLRTCAWLHARKAYLALSQALEANLHPLGLTAPQLAILAGVKLHPDQTPSAMARRIGLDRTTLYRTLRPLVTRGLIRSDGPEAGAQRRQLRITGEGLDQLERGCEAWAGFHAALQARHGAERWPALISTLAWLGEAGRPTRPPRPPGRPRRRATPDEERDA
jgi:DNA-binding MarR family transcriptional regulator